MPEQLRLSVLSLYPGAGEPQTCEGDESQVCAWVYKHFPQVERGHFRSVMELVEFLNQTVHGHEFSLSQSNDGLRQDPDTDSLTKAWPQDEKDNAAQGEGFFGSDSWKVHEDQLLEQGWGKKVAWNKQGRPSDKPVWGKRYPSKFHQPGFEPDNAPDGTVLRVNDAINANGGWGMPREPAGAYSWDPPDGPDYGAETRLANGNDTSYWMGIGAAADLPPVTGRERMARHKDAWDGRKQREADPAFRDRNIKPMKKVSLNPEESASRMTMTKPFFPQVYDRVHSYRTPEGFYHHVYDQRLGPEFLSQLHVISLHPSPLMETGMLASATTDKNPDRHDSFVNNPWGDSDFSHVSTIVSKYPRRGWGSLLYRSMGRLSHRLVSDSSSSAGDSSVWKKLVTDPEFRGEMGHPDDHGMTRHWAEHRGTPPQPYLEFSPKARALDENQQDFPWEHQHASALQREYEHLNAGPNHDYRQNLKDHLGVDLRPESSHPVPQEDLGILPPGLGESGNLQKSEDTKSSPQELVEDMLGFRPWDSDCFRAARTLASGIDPSLANIRAAVWDFPGDDISQALKAFGLQVNEKNRKVLQQVIKLQAGKQLKKNESQIPRQLDHIRALDDDGLELQQALRDGIDGRKVEVVDLGGRHSQGTLLVDTKDQGQWLLKPGHGQSPSAGAEEDPSSQSQRESGFWHVARRWGLSEDIPRTELMTVDGHQYAAIQMLDASWKNLGRVDVKDHRRVVQALERYRPGGQLHRWAVMDFVAGNPDRHAQNLMLGAKDQVKLIDHGTTFAGQGFDPAGDRKSFIPFYLRYQADPRTWVGMSPAAKQKRMPVIPSEEVREGLSQWILGLDPGVLQFQLKHFGIDPGPSLKRLQTIQSLIRADVHQPDRVLNRLWATT